MEDNASLQVQCRNIALLLVGFEISTAVLCKAVWVWCADMDECRSDPELCQPGLCKNTYGSYYCECQQGYSVKPGTTTCTGSVLGYTLVVFVDVLFIVHIDHCLAMLPANTTHQTNVNRRLQPASLPQHLDMTYVCNTVLLGHLAEVLLLQPIKADVW